METTKSGSRSLGCLRRGAVGGFLLMTLCFSLTLMVVSASSLSQGAVDPRPEHPVQEATWPATFPDQAADGILRMEVPAGSFAEFAAGGIAWQVPPLIRLDIDDQVVIVNHDTRPHMILYEFIPAGATVVLKFPEAGRHVYSSGCAANPMSNSFSTLIVK